MRFDVLTLFPDMIRRNCGESVIGRGQEAGFLQVYAHNIRDYSEDKHRRVDDTPYGGGKGMLLSPVPVCACYDAVKALAPAENCRTIYLSPKGKVLTQKKAAELAGCDRLILLCGHYEGIDERAIEEIGAEELSIGDYVLTGGELAAAVMADAIVRIIPGVISDEQSALSDSFQDNLLAAPVYTRPADYNGWKVPEILLSGHEAKIKEWELQQSLERTRRLRPDLLGEE